MLGSLIPYLKGMRTTMFQLSGFYCIGFTVQGLVTVFRALGLGPEDQGQRGASRREVVEEWEDSLLHAEPS